LAERGVQRSLGILQRLGCVALYIRQTGENDAAASRHKKELALHKSLVVSIQWKVEKHRRVG
jgi:hypothetical protein